MHRRLAFVLVLALGAAGAATAPSTAPATKPAATASAPAPATGAAAKKTTLDGIFSEEQVARGKKTYNASCARCHGDALQGNDDALPLVGKEFLDHWAGKSVGDLVEYNRMQMPADSAGNMTRRECTDITVYILSSNGMPAGKADIAPDLEQLNAVTIQGKK